jgi:CheY-like chemotaxis protein
VPRLTPDVDLAVDSAPANLERLDRLLAEWGYSLTAPLAATAAGVAVRRFRHPQSALGTIDIIPISPDVFARLQAGAAVATLVDLGIPVVGAADLQALKEGSGATTDREDADGLRVLSSIRAGEAGSDADTRREQIRKFARWSVAARLDWLLAAARLAKGMSPEAKPMTRGLVRRRGWYGR